MLQLDAAETLRALPFAELVPELARAARELAAGTLRAPERLVVPIEPEGTLLCMPAVAPDIGITKVVTVHASNRARGLPAIQGEVCVFEAASGRRLALLDGPVVTARRTAAVSLLAIDKLSLRRPQSALLIGTGAQAEAHARALVDYFGVRRFWVAATSLPSARAFADRLEAEHGVKAVPMVGLDIPPEGVGADVVVALTTSKTPVVPARLPAHTLAIGAGAFRPDMAELPPELLRARRVVVDFLAGARHEAGDLLQAGVSWDETFELRQLLDGAGASESRGHAFKSVGHASWDLAAARVALRHLALNAG
jgi:1-piperideine-2-carboxylate/1-pyrroline-2-carboxylate reductase [NAD(P)H]